MDKELRVRHCTAHDGQPLAVVHNLPGEGAELRPVQMRALAHALLAAADECEGRPVSVIPKLNERIYSLQS